MSSISNVLAKFVCGLTFDKIPNESIKVAKNAVLDTIGNALAGLDADEVKMLHDAVAKYDQTQDSTVLGAGSKVSSPNAAFLNAAASEARDCTGAIADVAVETVPVATALAVAEKEKGIDGKTLITSIVAGCEVMTRMAMTMDNETVKNRGFYPSGITGPYGAAATAGKLLNLNEEEMTAALGLAGSQALGNQVGFSEGLRVKLVFIGRAVETGVKSAYMAKNGVKGPVGVVESNGGWLKCFSDGKYSLERATHKIGEEFLTKNLCFKMYPCCRYCHPFIDTAFKVLPWMEEQKISLEDIEKITAHGAKFYGWYIAVERRPKTKEERKFAAQFSVGYCVARALKDKQITFEQFTDEKVTDPQVQELAKKVELVTDPEIESKVNYVSGVPPITLPAGLTVRTKDGREHSVTILYAKGLPGNPPTAEELNKKFDDQAKTVLPETKREKIKSTTERLEELKEVSDLVKLTVP